MADPRTFSVKPRTLQTTLPALLGTPRNKLGDDISVQFVGHIPQKIPDGDGRLARTPFVHRTVGIIVKDLLLEDIKGLVEFEPSVTRGEGPHENIGLGPFDGILVDAGVHGL